MLHLVLPHVRHQRDRGSVRLVCSDWRSAADSCWQLGAFNCALLAAGAEDPAQGAAETAAAAEAAWSAGRFLLPRLRELCLVELHSRKMLLHLLRLLTPTAVPALRRLVLSAPLGERLSLPDSGLLKSLGLTQLQHFELHDVEPHHGLSSFSHLVQLTALHLCLTAAPAGPRGSRPRSCCVAGVRHLTALQHLQALALPELAEQDREQLSALTSLTSLAFTAAGKGSVGPSLAPLAHLAALCISLAHVHDLFIVLHPQVDWGALRMLGGLRQLSVCHLAAFSLFPAPDVVTWSEDAPVAVEVDRLLAAQPGIEWVQLRLSYCRLTEEQATPEGQPDRLLIAPAADAGPGPGQTRIYLRSVERVPKRHPGWRRPDSWYESWWQEAISAQLEEEAAAAAAAAAASAAASAATAGVQEAAAAAQDGHGPDASPAAASGASRRGWAARLAEHGARLNAVLDRRQRDSLELSGWACIRPGSYRTFDTLATYSLVSSGAGSADVSRGPGPGEVLWWRARSADQSD